MALQTPQIAVDDLEPGEATNRDFQIGMDADSLTDLEPGEGDTPSTAEFSGLITDAPILTKPNDDGRVFIRQAVPLPLTLLAVIPRIEMGG